MTLICTIAASSRFEDEVYRVADIFQCFGILPFRPLFFKSEARVKRKDEVKTQCNYKDDSEFFDHYHETFDYAISKSDFLYVVDTLEAYNSTLLSDQRNVYIGADTFREIDVASTYGIPVYYHSDLLKPGTTVEKYRDIYARAKEILIEFENIKQINLLKEEKEKRKNAFSALKMKTALEDDKTDRD